MSQFPRPQMQEIGKPAGPPPKPAGILDRFVDEQTRSSVKIEVNAKDVPQVRVSVYEGTTEAQMQECLDLAIATLNAARRQLGLSQFGSAAA